MINWRNSKTTDQYEELVKQLISRDKDKQLINMREGKQLISWRNRQMADQYEELVKQLISWRYRQTVDQ